MQYSPLGGHNTQKLLFERNAICPAGELRSRELFRNGRRDNLGAISKGALTVAETAPQLRLWAGSRVPVCEDHGGDAVLTPSNPEPAQFYAGTVVVLSGAAISLMVSLI
jgi:hypothetical protein